MTTELTHEQTLEGRVIRVEIYRRDVAEIVLDVPGREGYVIALTTLEMTQRIDEGQWVRLTVFLEGEFAELIEIESRNGDEPMMSHQSSDAPSIGGADAGWQYMGLADCYGLASFMEYDRRLTGVMEIAANANPHRFSIVWACRMSTEDAEFVRALMDMREYEDALRFLNGAATVIGVAGISKHWWPRLPDRTLCEP